MAGYVSITNGETESADSTGKVVGVKNCKNIIETAEKIGSGFGQGAIIDWQVQKWFSKFFSGDTSVRDKTKTLIRHQSR